MYSTFCVRLTEGLLRHFLHSVKRRVELIKLFLVIIVVFASQSSRTHSVPTSTFCIVGNGTVWTNSNRTTGLW